MVDYPIALDPNYAVWNAFNNQYWPALYIVDAKGQIRHHQFGEGDYEPSERVIQQLLAEAGISGVSNELVSVNPIGAETAADVGDLQSPETYTGYGRSDSFASPGGAVLDKPHVYTVPQQMSLNQWSFAGNWTVGNPAAVLNQAGGQVAYRFHARDLNLVMGPAVQGASVRFRLFIDGQPADTAHGFDVDGQGNGTVNEPRMYQLIRQPTPIVDRQFEIEFLDPGVAVYDFTFG
jgi:hypothetical protein